MVRHIVMWKLKEEGTDASKKKNAGKLKLILEGLKANIEELKAVEVGIQISDEEKDALDVVLTCDFETEVDLQMYTRNPHHQKAIKFIESVAEQRFFVDYKMDL